MTKINIDNVNRIIEKHKSLYRDMLKKHYKPLLAKFIEELMQELNIENYSIDYGLDNATFMHLIIYKNNFQLDEIIEPYANRKYNDINHPCNRLFKYIESGQYEKERKHYVKNKHN